MVERNNQLVILEDRSALIDDSYCPRLRFWSRDFARGQLIPQAVTRCTEINQETKTITYNTALEPVPHPGGLAPLKKSVYLVLGGAVHHGLNEMMDHCQLWEREHGEIPNLTATLEDHILPAVDLALEEFDSQLSGGGISIPDAQTAEQVQWKLREARAMVEGLVIVAGMRLIPNLLERFRVVEVEREKEFELAQVLLTNHPVPVYPRVIFQSRADALLEERSTGDLYLHSWKTSGYWGRQEEEQFKRDVQGLSEAVGVEQATMSTIERADLGIPKVMGIQMAILLKGAKSKSKPAASSPESWGENELWHNLGPGLRYHYSPITHAWRMASHGILPEDDQSLWAWSYTFPKPENKSGQGRLGKGWEPVAPFDSYPGGTRRWLLDLLAGKWQPECGDPFAQSIAMPEPWSRSDREMEDWLEEAKARVEEIHPHAEEVRQAMRDEDWPLVRSLLNRYFPKHRQSCVRFGGTRCWADPLCFGPDENWQRPLEKLEELGLRLREPHHAVGGTKADE